MFVLLKLILSLFLRPLMWMIILFVYGWFTKSARRKRLSFAWGIGMLLFFTNPFIINTLLRSFETAPVPMEKLGQYNTGIILGGFIAYDRKDDAAYFNTVADRFVQTALLYKTGHIKKIIIPAGNGYIVNVNFKEANYVKQRFVELGIPPEDIYTDTESQNTLQNAINTKRISDSAHVAGPYLLISSAMHLPRAAKVFRKQGMNVDLYPCNFASRELGNNVIDDYILPSSMALRNWDSYIKELVGILTYKVTGKG